jgi:anti-sigma regulatory factor (Ser/Thr protein kinase)
MTDQLVKVFTNDPGNIRRARQAAGTFLAEHGLSDGLTAGLLVSELVTNAVCHGDGPIGLQVTIVGETFRVVVTDSGGGRPRLREPDPEHAAGGGWGLHVVDDAATAWGTHRRPGRTDVWFELPLGPAGAN